MVELKNGINKAKQENNTEKIEQILHSFLHTVGCGLCSNYKTEICKICVNHRSTHIFFNYKKEYISEIATEIINTIQK